MRRLHRGDLRLDAGPGSRPVDVGVRVRRHPLDTDADTDTDTDADTDAVAVVASDGTPSGTRLLPVLPSVPATDSAYGIGNLGNTQILAIEGAEGIDGLYAWSAVGSTTTAEPKRAYKARQATRRKISVDVRVAAASGARPSGGVVTLSRKGRTVGWSGTVDAAASASARLHRQGEDAPEALTGIFVTQKSRPGLPQAPVGLPI